MQDESRRQIDTPHPPSIAGQEDLETASASRVITAATIVAHIEWWLKARNLRSPSDFNQTFHETGFDSLHGLELALYLEKKLGMSISETALFDCPNFASLTEYLVSRCR